MDEKSEIAKFVDSTEQILPEDFLFRHIHFSKFDKPNKFPSPAAFVPDPDGLSLYWGKLINDIKEVFLTLGLSHSATGKFKDPTAFKLFKVQKQVFLDAGANDVIHSPVINGNPAPVGQPNIPSHSLALYLDSDLRVRVKLSEYCKDNLFSCYCKFQIDTITAELEELKKRLNDTPYHCY